MTKQNGSAHVIIIVGLIVLLLGSLSFIFWQNFIDASDEPKAVTQPNVSKVTENEDPKPLESYVGTYTAGGNFQVKIPNGWSVEAGAYDGYAKSQLVLPAGPNQLETLKYDKSSAAVINGSAGFGWDGLTEHFYMISQENSESDYSEYKEETFMLDNGIKGKKFTRVLNKADQQGMSVFQKDADSYTFSNYEFTSGDVTVTAYLNYYSNTSFDVDLGENVIRTLKF